MSKKFRLTVTDFVVGSLMVLLCLFFAYRIKVGLNYNWAWDLIPQFIFRFDDKNGEWVAGLLMTGFYTTLRLSFWGIILATVFGVLSGIAKTSNILFLRWLATTYVETMRNLPPLVIIFIAYFFFGTVFNLDRNVAGIGALALFAGAYVAEIIRAGIQSIAKGQMEAARSLGMSMPQAMIDVILPQAFKRILPPLSGQFISLIKDSSLVSVIAITDLTKSGREIITSTFATFEIWLVVAAMYLIVTSILSQFVFYLERRYRVSD